MQEPPTIHISDYLKYCSTEFPFPGLFVFRSSLLNKPYRWVAELAFNPDTSIEIRLDTSIPEIPRITYLCKCSSDIYQAYKQQQPFQADGKQKHIIICRPSPNFQTKDIDYFLLSPREQQADNMPFPKFAVQFYSIKPQDVQQCSQDLSV